MFYETLVNKLHYDFLLLLRVNCDLNDVSIFLTTANIYLKKENICIIIFCYLRFKLLLKGIWKIKLLILRNIFL